MKEFKIGYKYKVRSSKSESFDQWKCIKRTPKTLTFIKVGNPETIKKKIYHIEKRISSKVWEICEIVYLEHGTIYS